MSKLNSQKFQMGEAPNDDELFYIRWGQELLQHNLSFINDVLRQLVSLNSAFLAGSLFFLDEVRVGILTLKIINVLFFLSLFVSFLGIMPYAAKVDMRKPKDIEQYYHKSLRWKTMCTWLAALMLAGAAAMVLISYLLR